MSWTPDALGDLSGKTYFITGANSGIGLEATRILCARGAHVAMGARTRDKADVGIAQVRETVPDASIDFVQLDLTDPASISAAADAVRTAHPRLDALVCNAGVMQTPDRLTAEGFELQLSTNHLGHFRLCAALYPHLAASGGRIVVVSSIVHHRGAIDFDDLMSRKSNDPTRAYSQSKLANLLFALELHRRLQAAGSPVVSIPCHPGYSATNLQHAGVGMAGGSWFVRAVYAVTTRVLAQSAEHGSWPLCLAAADPDAEGGVYYGPTGLGDMGGPVGRSRLSRKARDEGVARRLWEETEKLVGPFPLAPD